MRIRHKLTETGLVPILNTRTKGIRISDALSCNVNPSARTSGPEDFSSNAFQALLYSWIVTDNGVFRKMESPRFHALLRYLNPRCERLLPSHQTVSRTTGDIYDKQLGVVTETLGAAVTKINFSFDL